MRGCSASHMNTSPSSWSASIESGCSKFSVDYAERMKDETCAYQMEVENDIPSFSFAVENTQGSNMDIDTQMKDADLGTNLNENATNTFPTAIPYDC